MEPTKRVGDSSLSSAKKKRKSQPKLDGFFIKPLACVVDNASKDVVNASGSASGSNVATSVGSNSQNVTHSQDLIKKTKRRWRPQWNLLHPWVYLCKTMLNESIIKCTFCEEAKKANTYTQEGSAVFMISALYDHSRSKDHVDAVHLLNAEKRMKDAGRGPLDDGVESMIHTEQMRILSCMKVVYFCACEDITLDKYLSHCKLLRELSTPNMPASDEYGSYVNPVSGREMMLAVKDHVKMHMLAEMRANPFYSILIDESTDRTMEKHLIVYVIYVGNKGKGRARCCFVELLPVIDANAKGIYNALIEFLECIGLDVNKLIAIATDGASVMIGHNTGLVARFQNDMPRIMGVHCIAHRQALAAKDGFVSHPHVYAFVDKVANKVYAWLGKSGKRHEELWKIMSEYDMGDVKALQIHSVRWLSRGQVMERFVNIMPAVLEQWQRHEKKWYGYATLFVVQFMIHLLADVLVELNKLNVEFQRQEMDVTTIGALINLTFEKLNRRYITSDANNFGVGSPYLFAFLKMAKEGKVVYTDANGKSHSHVLKFKAIPTVKNGKKTAESDECEEDVVNKDVENEDANNLDLNVLPEESAKENGSLEECISMAKSYVQNILDGLNRRFEDLPIFNAFKIFCSSCYPVNAIDREKKTQE
ncbi:hypothetical protein L7F22_036356 [Adiantum nelumboides]|nr:hypothetical protein [Adiantum nelumboides]